MQNPLCRMQGPGSSFSEKLLLHHMAEGAWSVDLQVAVQPAEQLDHRHWRS
jgi:hypothetical protein